MKIALIVLACLAGLLLVFLAYIVIRAKCSVKNLRRLDAEGFLYACDYVGNYRTPLLRKPLVLLRGGGCSCFSACTAEGEELTGRNYDLPHKDKEGNITGLNMQVTLRPKGAYASVNFADACWIAFLKLPYFRGAFEKGVTRLPLVFLPYLCMDGMNEKGLVASILALDSKPGERPMKQKDPSKKTVMITELLREILDTCATLEEAVRLTESRNIICTLGRNYHLFVKDASGHSAVFEWREDRFFVTYTDACTNFYVGSDDAEDCWYGDVLKERFLAPSPVKREYHYGYGHGFERFRTLVTTLDAHRETQKASAILSREESMALLAKVSQDYIPGSPTSLTQYSAVYDQTRRRVALCSVRDYQKIYTFEVFQ